MDRSETNITSTAQKRLYFPVSCTPQTHSSSASTRYSGLTHVGSRSLFLELSRLLGCPHFARGRIVIHCPGRSAERRAFEMPISMRLYES